jgi:hypothetical protein
MHQNGACTTAAHGWRFAGSPNDFMGKLHGSQRQIAHLFMCRSWHGTCFNESSQLSHRRSPPQVDTRFHLGDTNGKDRRRRNADG